MVELGDPKEAAAKYLKEKGIRVKDPDQPGFFSSLFRSRMFQLIILILVGGSIWNYYYGSPSSFIEAKKIALTLTDKIGITKEAAKTIQVPDQKNDVAGGSNEVIQKPTPSGNISLTSVTAGSNQTIREISVEFEKGNWNVYWGKSTDLKWNCSGVGGIESSISGTSLLLKPTAQSHLNCNLILAFGKALKIKGQEGQISLIEPDTVSSADMKNGVISFKSSPTKKYNFRNNIKEGGMGNLESSNDPYAIPIYMSVENGKIVGQ